MRFFSTRGAHETDFIGAVSQGLAADGCLYVPEELPRFDPRDIEGNSLEEIGAQLLAPFAAGSPLAPELGALCAQALDFPVPLVPVDKGRGPLWVLEVFHGPTAAFKDVGARFTAAGGCAWGCCFQKVRSRPGRSTSSPAGRTTYVHSKSTGPLMTARAWSRVRSRTGR